MLDSFRSLQVFMLPFAQKEERGVLLRLHVQPGASRSEFAGLHGDALKLRIAARPEEGAANRAVCAFLAESFALPKTSVSILHGQSSRKKIVLIQGDANRILLALEKLAR
jgi:uncharacterized protein